MHCDFSLLTEYSRLKELLKYQILDTPRESDFDNLVKLAANIFNVPVAAITFIDKHRQWVKASVGITICETDRQNAICNYTIRQEKITEIEDLSSDPRFNQLSYVQGGPSYRFYAGIPLVTHTGYPIGVFCLVHTRPHRLNNEEKVLLEAFAKAAMIQVEISLKSTEFNNIMEVKKRVLGIISQCSNLTASNSLVWQQADQQDAGDPLNAPDLEVLYDMLKKEAHTTNGLLNDMKKNKRMQLYKAIDKLQDIHFKQTVQNCLHQIEPDILQAGN